MIFIILNFGRVKLRRKAEEAEMAEGRKGLKELKS